MQRTMTSRWMLRSVLLVGACWSIGVGTAEAEPQGDMLLGSDGQVFSIVAGEVASLFPESPGNVETALALDIRWPDGDQQRHLVPGTEGREPENHPFLVLDGETQTLYLLWESVVNYLHPIVNLITFQDGTWGERIEIISSAFAAKASPQMLVQHDEVQELDASGKLTARRRTVVHVVWGEDEFGTGRVTYYVPVVIDHGVTLLGSPLRLNDLFPEIGVSTATDGELRLTSVIRSGSDERRALIVFPNPGGDGIGIVELDVLPGDLAHLAEGARGHIIDIGFTGGPLSPADIRSIADKARGHIIDIGVAYHPEVIRAIADEARGHIIDIGVRGDGGAPPDLQRIADSARGHIIDIGSKLTERGLRRAYAGGETRRLTVSTSTEDAPMTPVLIQAKAIATHAQPELSGTASHAFVSPGGEDVIFARVEEERVIYRQHRLDGWTPPLELKLGPGLDLDTALSMLQGRVRSR